jgi:CRISPR-associated protein Csx10
MMQLKVIVELRSPLVLGSGMDVGNVRESRPFIAGSVLRGVLAQVILDSLGIRKNTGRKITPPSPESAQYEEAFRKVFLDPKPARFGNLYPFSLTDQNSPFEAFPIPLTAFTCKPSPGFGKKDNEHGVFDLLLSSILQKQSEEERCPFCRERLERERGFAIRTRKDGELIYQKANVPMRQFVRVGLSRYTEAAEEQILYVLEAILPKEEGKNHPLAFIGNWAMSKEQWELLESLMKRFFFKEDDGYRLRIGSSRARGMGEAVLKIQAEKVPFLIASQGSQPSALEERLCDFQSHLKNSGLADGEHLYFSLSTRSPILVFGKDGLPTKQLTPKVLASYVEAKMPGGLELIKKATFIEQETLTGWSQAWGMPKPVAPAISAGSVFAYRVPRAAEKIEDENELLDFLRYIEENGIGERLGEGFGEVCVCDPFHIDKDLERQKRQTKGGE